MTFKNRGEALHLEEYDGEWFYVRGHNLADAEIWKAILALDSEMNGECFADADAQLLTATHEIKFRREQWERCVPCYCGEEHPWDLEDAKPKARGAFPVTVVRIKVKERIES